MYADAEALVEDYFERGWTDGLPVTAPTPARVQAFLEAAQLSTTEVVGTVSTREVVVTAEDAAINAVMAGCRPEYFPVVVAALRAHFSVLGNSHSTTGSLQGPAHALIVNGPISTAIGVANGQACMGPGFRANATIGRAIRLVIRNVCHSTPELLDRATFSSPLRYSFCFAENEAGAHPWQPLHVQRGYARTTSTVTVASVVSVVPIISRGDTPGAILADIATELRFGGLAGTGSDLDQFLGDSAGIVLVVGQEHMQCFHEAGWSKMAMQEDLLGRLVAPSRRERDRPFHYSKPEQILLVAAGGEGVPETHALTPHLSAPVTEPIVLGGVS